MTFSDFQNQIGYQFSNPALLYQALTHKSYSNELKTENISDNEKMEFLGDAVLDLVLSDQLMRLYVNDNEGQLSKKRASLVNEVTLHESALSLGVGELLRLGRGEASTGGAEKPRILASALEAIFGAVFLDGGFNASQLVILDLFKEKIISLSLMDDFQMDYKTRLQEKLQKEFKQVPQYHLIGEDGPEHNKVFKVEVAIDNKILGRGEGRSKKQAEQAAAAQALEEYHDL